MATTLRPTSYQSTGRLLTRPFVTSGLATYCNGSVQSTSRPTQSGATKLMLDEFIYVSTSEVSISGQITFNIWAAESAMTTNAGLRVEIWRCDEVGNELELILGSSEGTELGTSGSARNWSATPPSAVTVRRGEKIKASVYIVNQGTMGTGSVTIWYDSPTSGVSGDSYITFTETISTVSVGTYTTFWATIDGGWTGPDIESGSTKVPLVIRNSNTDSDPVRHYTNTVAGPTTGQRFYDDLETPSDNSGAVVVFATHPLNGFTLPARAWLYFGTTNGIKASQDGSGGDPNNLSVPATNVLFVRYKVERTNFLGTVQQTIRDVTDTQNLYSDLGAILQFFNDSEAVFATDDRIKVTIYLDDLSYVENQIANLGASVPWGKGVIQLAVEGSITQRDEFKTIMLGLLDGTNAIYAPTVLPQPVTVGVLPLVDGSNAIYAPTLAPPPQAIGPLSLQGITSTGRDYQGASILLGSSTTEFVIADCDYTVQVSPTTIDLDVWTSIYAYGQYSKEYTLRLRRTNTSGTILASHAVLRYDDNTSGHADHWVTQYVDNSPTDGHYVLTLQIQPGEWGDVYSDELLFWLTAGAASVYAPELIQVQVISLGLLDASSAIYAPTILPQPIGIDLSLLDGGSAVYTPTLIPAALTLVLDLLDGGATAYVPTILPQPIAVSLTLLDGGAAVYTPTVALVFTVSVGLLDGGSAAYVPTLEPQAVVVLLGLLDGAASLYAPVVELASASAQALTLDLLDGVRAVYAPTVIRHLQLLTVGRITRTPAVYAPTVRRMSGSLFLPLLGTGPNIYSPFVVQGLGPGFVSPTYKGRGMAIHVDDPLLVSVVPAGPVATNATYQGRSKAIYIDPLSPSLDQRDIHSSYFTQPQYRGTSKAIHVKGTRNDLITPDPVDPCQDGGGCSGAVCGITDSFSRVQADLWGTCDAGLLWDLFDPEEDWDQYTSVAHVSVTGEYGKAHARATSYQTGVYVANRGTLLTQRRHYRLRATFDVLIAIQGPPHQAGQSSFGLSFFGYGFSWAKKADHWAYLASNPNVPTFMPGGDYLRINNAGYPSQYYFFGEMQKPLAGDWYHCRIEADYGSQLRFRMWPEDIEEPEDWTMTLPLVGEQGGENQNRIWFSIDQYAGVYWALQPDGSYIADQATTAEFEVRVRALNVEGVTRCDNIQFDDFQRTISPGLGTSTDGHVWTTHYAPGGGGFSVDADVAEGVAKLAQYGADGGMPGSTGYRYALLSAAGTASDPKLWEKASFVVDAEVFLRGFDKYTRFGLDAGDTGEASHGLFLGPGATNWGTPIVGFYLRFAAQSGEVTNDPGPVGVSLFDYTTGQNLRSDVAKTWAMSNYYTIRYEMEWGVQHRVKVWLRGTAEPSGWDATQDAPTLAAYQALLAGTTGRFAVAQKGGYGSINLGPTYSPQSIDINYIEFDYENKPCYLGSVDVVDGNYDPWENFDRPDASSWGSSWGDPWSTSGSVGTEQTIVNNEGRLFCPPNKTCWATRNAEPDAFDIQPPWAIQWTLQFSSYSSGTSLYLGSACDLELYPYLNGYYDHYNDWHASMPRTIDWLQPFNVLLAQDEDGYRKFKIWQVGDTEPADWDLSLLDDNNEYSVTTSLYTYGTGAGPATVLFERVRVWQGAYEINRTSTWEDLTEVIVHTYNLATYKYAARSWSYGYNASTQQWEFHRDDTLPIAGFQAVGIFVETKVDENYYMDPQPPTDVLRRHYITVQKPEAAEVLSIDAADLVYDQGIAIEPVVTWELGHTLEPWSMLRGNWGTEQPALNEPGTVVVSGATGDTSTYWGPPYNGFPDTADPVDVSLTPPGPGEYIQLMPALGDVTYISGGSTNAISTYNDGDAPKPYIRYTATHRTGYRQVTSSDLSHSDKPGCESYPAPIEAGYLPTFRRQIGDPTTTLDSYICGLTSAAMVLDWHTRGAVKVWGGELIPWCGRTEAEIIAAPGTNLGNAAQAWTHWGQLLSIRSGQTFDHLLAALAEGRAVVLSGDYDQFNLLERCQDSFLGNHGISVYPYKSGSMWLVGDPLCTGFNGISEASLRDYAEDFGIQVYGVTSPQKIVFAVSRAWTV